VPFRPLIGPIHVISGSQLAAGPVWLLSADLISRDFLVRTPKNYERARAQAQAQAQPSPNPNPDPLRAEGGGPGAPHPPAFKSKDFICVFNRFERGLTVEGSLCMAMHALSPTGVAQGIKWPVPAPLGLSGAGDSC
jgi:hypothetical protein